MSAEGGGREVAYRLFAAEYDDASLSHAESDEERAPNYVITPTGARVNRLFVVGTLTEITRVNDEMLRARVVDPTGAFVVYAGQYQPDELAALERLEPPAFVAVTGKARTFQPDDSDQVYTSIRPETIATVDADTRDRWVVSTAEQTRGRIGTYAAAAELDAAGEELTAVLRESGVDEGLATGIPLAQGHYGTTPAYLEALEALSVDAARVVSGELDQVEGLSLEPDAAGDATTGFDELVTVDLEAPTPAAADEPVADGEATPVSATATAVDAAGESEASVGDDASAADTSGEVAEEQAAVAETDGDSGLEESEPSADGDSATESETEPASEDTATFDEGEVAASEPADDDESAAEDDELGDFEAGAELGGEMYEMDDEEREELEAEFGSEFTTGAEVEEPGNADIDVPETEEASDDEPEADEESGDETEPAEADSDPDTDTDGDADLESPTDETEHDTLSADDGEDVDEEADEDESAVEDVDLQSQVVETMSELDDGDGADRDAVVETVASETGAPEGDVEDAIEEALMGGQCYEPSDGSLKAI